MRLYEGSITDFRADVMDNTISDKMAQKYEQLIKKRVSESEYRSWQQSLNFLKNALDFSNLTDNRLILEYQLPYCGERIDVLLFGKDEHASDNVVLMELKQWSNDHVADCEAEGTIIVDYGRLKKRQPHPSRQVEGYHYGLKDNVRVFEETPLMSLNSCVYCHNYSKTENAVLYLPKFQREITTYRIFSKEEAKELGNYLRARLESGHGLDVFNRFVNSPLRPSKKLLEHVREMINKQQIFNLIDDQIAAYNTIMHEAKKLAKSNEKSVIIVKGGPGTGKSVIALEVMAELLRKGKQVFHATGSSAFTKTLRKLLGVRLQNRFKFFFSFTQHGDNEIDVLICDEAHRIRKDSGDYGVPYNLRSKTPQVDDLVRCSKLSVFFIDEHQVVRPNEIGSVSLIKEAAKKLGVSDSNIVEFELKTQFRCSGSDIYLQWLENILGIIDSDLQILPKASKMTFEIVDSPNKLKEIIREKNKEKQNCARIVAGFCWPWSKPNADGTLVDDVVIGDFAMPWENKQEFWKWATEESGMDQVGTIYTAQGFEFDYIGVLFSNDLAYDPQSKTWVSKPENSHDSMVKRGNKMLTQHLKNVYRVLLSRAHKGVYIYFMDKATEELFRSRIEV